MFNFFKKNILNIFKCSQKFRYLDNENIVFNNKIIRPNYSSIKSFAIFKKVILKILNNPNKKKNIYVEGYNILTIALEDFYWQFCFQYIKYKKFFDKEGFCLKPKLPFNKKIYKIDGYGRVKTYFEGNKTLMNFLNVEIRKIFFCFWILKNLFFNKNKIWIDRSFLKDMRYKNLLFDPKRVITIPYSLTSMRKKINNIEDALIEDAKSKIKNYKFWLFAINFLKPSKIILRDNLYDNYSLLLAAKISNTECEAISHSPTCRFHMNTFGLKYFKENEILKFDKFYVYNKIFKDFIIKFSNFYKKNDIKIIKWINNNSYNFKIKRNKNKIYVLYAFEHFCNFQKINKILLFLQNKGHKIIVKKRPDMINYNHFDYRLKIKFVDDFKYSHVKNCLCFFGSTTGLIFNLSQNLIPILYLYDCGYNHFKGINYPKNWIMIKNINNKIYKKISKIKINKGFII
tara:strand:+ start:3533 stop:4903 length:1371 start_codon:yes stop_codon:yes gene_type:complete